jgi:hypothetical protein
MFFVSVMRFVTGCSLTLQQSIKASIPWDLTDGAPYVHRFGRSVQRREAVTSDSLEQNNE